MHKIPLGDRRALKQPAVFESGELFVQQSPGTVYRYDEQIQYGDKQQLVICKRLPEVVERAVYGKDARTVKYTEEETPPGTSGRGCRICNQQVQAQKNRGRDAGINKPVGAGHGSVKAWQRKQHER